MSVCTSWRIRNRNAIAFFRIVAKDAREVAVQFKVYLSGGDGFVRTCLFYGEIGWTKESRIRFHFELGDDNISFRKAL